MTIFGAILVLGDKGMLISPMGMVAKEKFCWALCWPSCLQIAYAYASCYAYTDASYSTGVQVDSHPGVPTRTRCSTREKRCSPEAKVAALGVVLAALLLMGGIIRAGAVTRWAWRVGCCDNKPVDPHRIVDGGPNTIAMLSGARAAIQQLDQLRTWLHIRLLWHPVPYVRGLHVGGRLPRPIPM